MRAIFGMSRSPVAGRAGDPCNVGYYILCLFAKFVLPV